MRRRLLAAGVVLALAATAASCPPPGPGPSPSTSAPASPATPPATPPTTPALTPTGGPATPTPDPTAPPGGFPNSATTGAPVESGLRAGPCSLAANTVYDGYEFNCDVDARTGTVIKNSVVRGQVKGDPAGQPFTVQDTTIIGPGCRGEAAVGNSNLVLRRVHIKGFNDGVRSEGPNVKVHDSLIEICFLDGGHADGLQVCPNPPCGGFADTSGLVFDHNTVTHPKLDSTGAVFVMGGNSPGGKITNNLLGGFSITLRVHSDGYTVTGNRLIDDSWLYGPVDCDGAGMLVWSDNRLVTIGAGYAVVSTGAAVTCG